jgi:hypothetical protein
VPAAGDPHADVDEGELVQADEEEGLVDLEKVSRLGRGGRSLRKIERRGTAHLEAEDFGLHEGERFAVYFDEAFAFL